MVHPLLSGAAPVGVIQAENPTFRSRGGHDDLIRDLRAMGLRHEEIRGQFGGLPERAVVVHGIDPESLVRLGQAYGQEAVVHHGNGHRWLMYTNGPRQGLAHPLVQASVTAEPPEDGYLSLPGHGHVVLGYDKDRLAHTGLPAGAEQGRVHPTETLGKSCGPRPQWAGGYPHHDGHTKHHAQQFGPGVLVAAAGLEKVDPSHPHMDGPKNDQASDQTGTQTYAQIARQYGTIAPGRQPDLKFYALQGKLPQVQKMVAEHGYQPTYFGGRYGRPDLATRNYNTKFLQIHDPTPKSGGDFADRDYTDAWRQSHELAHALTYPSINEIYGEGRRIGKLGVHRSLREAARAVHWEHLTTRKQRELLGSIGVHVPDDVWHKELNTTMHDAVHRAITGKFSEPSDEGFWPHSHEVPLEHSLQIVRDHARKIGLTGDHDLLRKSDDPERAAKPAILPQDQEKNLRNLKDINQSVARRTEALVALRKAELAYPSGPGEKCMICQSPAQSCQCLADLRKFDEHVRVDRPCDVCGHNPCECEGTMPPKKTPDATPKKSGAGGGEGEKAKLVKDDVPTAKPPSGTKPPAPPKPALPKAPGLMKAAPGIAGPPAVPAMVKDEDDHEDESKECPSCGGHGKPLGSLGSRKHYRCEGCGMDFSHKPAEPPKKDLKKSEIPSDRAARLDKIAEVLAKGEIDARVIESLAKSFLGGKDAASQAMTQHASMAAPVSKPSIPGKSAPKLSPEDHARRAADLAAFTPAGAFQASGKGSSLGGPPKPVGPKPPAAVPAVGKPMGTTAQPKLLDRFHAALKGGGMQKGEEDPAAGRKPPLILEPKPAVAEKKLSLRVNANPAGAKAAVAAIAPMKKGAEFGSMPMGPGNATTGGVGAMNMSEKDRK